MRYEIRIWTHGREDDYVVYPLTRVANEHDALEVARLLLRAEPLCCGAAIVEVDPGAAPGRVVWESKGPGAAFGSWTGTEGGSP